jgi:voltage-gated potassium channel
VEEPAPLAPQPRSAAIVVRTLLRMAGTITAAFVIYALVPSTVSTSPLTIAFFVVALVAFAFLVGFEVRSVLRATYPALRALEVIALLAPVFLVLFSTTYLRMSQTNEHTFNVPLDHINALYFTVVTFATVGFGDIVAKTDSARLLVTIQILLDLAFIGLVVRLLFGAVQRRLGRPTSETV